MFRPKEYISPLFGFLARGRRDSYRTPAQRSKATQENFETLLSGIEGSEATAAEKALCTIAKRFPDSAEQITRFIITHYSQAPQNGFKHYANLLAHIAAHYPNDLRTKIRAFLKERSEDGISSNHQDVSVRLGRAAAIRARGLLGQLRPELAEEIFEDLVPHAFQDDHIHISYQYAIQDLIKTNSTLAKNYMLFFDILSQSADWQARWLSTSFLFAAGSEHQALKPEAERLLKRLETDEDSAVKAFAKMWLEQMNPKPVKAQGKGKSFKPAGAIEAKDPGAQPAVP